MKHSGHVGHKSGEVKTKEILKFQLFSVFLFGFELEKLNMKNRCKYYLSLFSILVFAQMMSISSTSETQAIDVASSLTNLQYLQWNLRGEILSEGSTAAIAKSYDISNLDQIIFKRILLLIHILGTAIGLGATIFLDIYFVRRLYHRAIDSPSIELLKFGSNLVSLGLVMLWISGLGFLLHYLTFAPDSLANPKIWAKVSIVVLLTINGIILHKYVFNFINQSKGKPLLEELNLNKAMIFLFPGAISATCWFFSVVLGVVKEFNFMFTVSTFLGFYISLLAVAIIVLSIGHLTRQMTRELGLKLR